MSFVLPGAPRRLDDQPHGLKPLGLWLGKGDRPLEVAAYQADHAPTKTVLVDVYKKRRGGRANPVLVVISNGSANDGRCALIGPIGEEPTFVTGILAKHAETICRAAIDKADRHHATRFLVDAMGSLGTPVPGLRNEGFLANHELQSGVIQRPDWPQATRKATAAISKRGRELVQNLGYAVEEDPAGKHSILMASNRKSAVALYLESDETPDQAAPRFNSIDPVTFALSIAKRENVDFVILTTPTSIRLYPVNEGVGIAQRGRTQTYIDVNLNVLSPQQAGYLWLLFSADAITPEGTLKQILQASTRFRSHLGERLRDRVYDDVIPHLATAIARQRKIKRPTTADLELTYQMALHHLFRVLFIAYAEDKNFLPYSSNGAYRSRSLKQKALELLEAKQKGTAFGPTDRLWKEVEALCNAIDKGDPSIGVPPYNGGLFSADAKASLEGAELATIQLDDATYAPILTAILVDKADDQEGPVDFRSLGVREFGTIYEGLLESELSVAETDLVLDSKSDTYRPAKTTEKPAYRAGTYYLAGTSGNRKATGSYYTKDFAVQHLLQQALQPALTEHIKRLDSMKDAVEASTVFFDFRVADISMGSGHFLVAAVDHIESRLSDYLAHRNLPGVRAELNRLREQAHHAMGDLLIGEIDDAQLLRRQIARRCIYGVDLKPAAVELARVSIWIHTFVAGLPLSLLDQHLVVGNSLTGIGTLEEADRLIRGEKEVEVKEKKKGKKVITGKTHKMASIFSGSAKELMAKAAEAMLEVGKLGDATTAEVRQARQEWERAKKAAEPWVALLDILAAGRIDENLALQAQQVYDSWSTDPKAILQDKRVMQARAALKGLNPCHFLAAFPEVFFTDKTRSFGRERAGFDVIVGNPPWEEATVEEDKFWLRVHPGLKSMGQGEAEEIKARLRKERPDLWVRFEEEQQKAERMRNLLTGSDYPGMGTGDPDLYKAFCWRFWHLLGPGGQMGVVLPRSALAAKGSAEFRKRILQEGMVNDLTFLLNRAEWAFADVEVRYTIGLVSIRKAKPEASTPVPIRGPFASLQRFEAGVKKPPVTFQLQDLLSWTDTAALPLLPNEDSPPIFAQLRKAPRFDRPEPGGWAARPYAEFHATNDKKVNGGVIEFLDKPPKGYWPVCGGESFDTWTNDTGSYYGFAKVDEAIEALYQARLRSANREASPFANVKPSVLNDRETLECKHPRVAFRDVARATDTRTCRAALVPPHVFLVNTAPFLVWSRGDTKDQAFVLAVLCSIPLDWYARRFVEIHLNYNTFNPLPVPRPARSSPLWKRAVLLGGRLAASDDRFTSWAASAEVQCGPLKEETKEAMVHELDAVVAHLYGLNREHLIHIFETFHEGWDYKDRLAATLKHFDAWEGKA